MWFIVSVLALVCTVMITTASSVQPRDALQGAARMLGVASVRTLEFTASGASFTVGQNFRPDDPWPRVTVKRFTATIDYDATRMRLDLVRDMGAMMPPGGGVPFFGERRQMQIVRPDGAWDVPVPPDQSAGSLPTGPCTSPEAGGTAPMAVASPQSAAACRLLLWSTPHGFMKAALANHATTKAADGGTLVSFMIDGKYRMIGTIDAAGDLVQVRTWVAQSIVGDMLIEIDYRDYRDFGGVRFPSRIVQRTDGFPSLELTVADVTVNHAVEITAPEVPNAPSTPATVKSQRVADGVFWLTGGTHHSLAIAMRDHIVLVDTPNSEARALAVIAKAKELIPGKPVGYVVAMHHHWDHLGGIRTAIDEGAVIVSHESNKKFLERAAIAPHTIDPDRLALSHRALRLQPIGDHGTLSDGTRTIELYAMRGFDHTADMLLVSLPTEKILAEADAYSPPETPTTPLILPKVPYAAALYENIRRLQLNVQTIVPFHGSRTADITELAQQATAR
jgi:glyoxylase-like metal-dependent hydrolase (beta-lactamase superfamily II)